MTHRATTHPPTLLLLGLLFQVGVSFAPGPPVSVPWMARLFGGALILVGVALNLSAVRDFEQDDTPVRPMSPPRALVTHGVFRWTRNPMYLGFALVLLGAALALASVWAVAAVPLFVLRINPLIRHEEELLAETFGEGFLSYRGKVRRWL